MPPRRTNTQKPVVKAAVEPVEAPKPVEASCECEAKLRELEKRLRFLEIRIL